LDISKHDGLGQEDEAQLKKISQALQLPLEQCL
ncbi:tciA domain protein, partial [Escherichia coli]|nr:tciA domain protein [Escherichia coli]